MSEENGYATREEFAKGFVRSFKQAIRIAKGEEKGTDAMEHVKQLMAEVDVMKREETENEN